jgi:hypothetical protein
MNDEIIPSINFQLISFHKVIQYLIGNVRMSFDYKTEFLSLIHSHCVSERMYCLLSCYTCGAPSELITVQLTYRR